MYDWKQKGNPFVALPAGEVGEEAGAEAMPRPFVENVIMGVPRLQGVPLEYWPMLREELNTRNEMQNLIQNKPPELRPDKVQGQPEGRRIAKRPDGDRR